MNEQNSVLNIIGKVSGFLSKYIAVVILITSAVAFTHTQKFMWIPQYTALFLGTAMFGMGLTIKREDFQIVFSRPKEVISGISSCKKRCEDCLDTACQSKYRCIPEKRAGNQFCFCVMS